MSATALVTAQDADEMILQATANITEIAGRGDVTMFVAPVTLPASFQYVIPGKKTVGDSWVADNKVGITSDGYDYLNRVVGVSFWTPPTVPNSAGEMVANPILQRDYIRWRMGGFWYNEVGQLVSMVEDLEIDYQMVYQAARLESFDSEVLLDQNGQPRFDDKGNPIIKLKNAAEEKKALKALHQLRTMGPRYAQTVLRTRILKVATGIKSLPGNEPKTRTIRVVGFRDTMDPIARLEQAQEASSRIFGTKQVDEDAVQRAPDEVVAEIEGGMDTGDRAIEDVHEVLGAVMDDDGQSEFDFGEPKK